MSNKQFFFLKHTIFLISGMLLHQIPKFISGQRQVIRRSSYVSQAKKKNHHIKLKVIFLCFFRMPFIIKCTVEQKYKIMQIANHPNHSPY